MTEPADDKPPFTASAPDSGFPVSGRTVEITDEDESIVIAFLPVGPQFVLPPDRHQPKKGKLP
jgi:hypothetical protein